MEIAKANESLKAAEQCYTEKLYNSSVSRAYYSMYQSAQVALETAGIYEPDGLTEDSRRLLPTSLPGEESSIRLF
jgi:hypothetical protein